MKDFRYIVFMNIDTQKDFMLPEGSLYTKNAEKILPILKKITEYSKKNGIKVINTCDWHYDNSRELSVNPDFINTFPQHCMANTDGADYVDEVKLDDFYRASVIGWEEKYNYDVIKNSINRERNIIIRKDAFSVFEGNQNFETVLKILNAKEFYVYGVVTQVCVNYVVCGLLDKGYKVNVIVDAIKALPNFDDKPFVNNWVDKGAKLILSSSLQ